MAAITIRAGVVSKKRNSTYKPTSELSDSYSCYLKEATTEDAPSFLISANSFPYNYVRWGDNYYFVESVVYERAGLMRANCKLDVLATFKNSILNTTAYVLYDTAPNTEISDKRLSVLTTSTRQDAAGNAFDYLGKGFCVALNTVGQDSCCTYIVTVQKALTLLNHASVWNADYFPEVEDPESGTVFQDVVGAIQKLDRIITYACRQFITSSNAANCITSACLIPVPYSAFSEAESEIYLGLFNTTVTGKRRMNRGFQDAATVSIPWQASDWRRNSPYHEIYLYIPFIGNISIPTSSVIGASQIYVNAAIDETAGDAIFTVSVNALSAGSANGVIGQYSTNLSANFAIGSSNVTAKQLATTVTSGVAAAVASVAAPGVGTAAAAGAAGIVGEMNGITSLGSSIGGAGGGAVLALFGYAPRCMTIFHNTNVDPSSVSTVIGTPAMAVKQLSTLSGFVQTSNAHVAIPGHLDNTQEIDSLINTGFFIE